MGYRSSWVSASTIALLLPSAPSLAAPAPVVVTASGPVRGLAQGGGAIFKGIPFAAAATGDRRWKPTEPATPWRTALDASDYGPVCPQPADSHRQPVPQSEDCLTINVATPKLARGGGALPVLVMIHGGAYFVGSNRERFDDAARVYNRRGIVVVAMNYRLGRLGFFAHPALRAEQPGAPVGNYWLMDQIAALQWVKRNIGAFGGDPAKVTILGCSAGGSSINALMASPASRALFARASARSGGGINNATRPLAQAEREGIAFARRAIDGRAGADPDIAAPGSTDPLARLRKLDPAQIIAADPGPPNFGAIVDGRLLPEETALSFLHGRIARVPFLVGSTSNEASVFGLMGFDEAALRKRFGIDMTAVRSIYEAAGPLSQNELLRQVQTDFIFTAGATALGSLAARWQPSYAYHFAYVPPPLRRETPGAPHCADMGYVFGDPALMEDRDNARVGAMLQDYTANFIRTGNPNGLGLARWPQFRGPSPSLLLIDDRTAAVADYRKAQLAYWHAQWAKRTGQQIR